MKGSWMPAIQHHVQLGTEPRFACLQPNGAFIVLVGAPFLRGFFFCSLFFWRPHRLATSQRRKKGGYLAVMWLGRTDCRVADQRAFAGFHWNRLIFGESIIRNETLGLERVCVVFHLMGWGWGGQGFRVGLREVPCEVHLIPSGWCFCLSFSSGP